MKGYEVECGIYSERQVHCPRGRDKQTQTNADARTRPDTPYLVNRSSNQCTNSITSKEAS